MCVCGNDDDDDDVNFLFDLSLVAMQTQRQYGKNTPQLVDVGEQSFYFYVTPEELEGETIDLKAQFVYRREQGYAFCCSLR